MSYSEDIAKARRLSILLALYFAPGYTLPRAALRDQVNKTGFITSHDLMASEITWLGEQGLIEPLELEAVRLTQRGEDVALGVSQNPGVSRPRPGQV